MRVGKHQLPWTLGSAAGSNRVVASVSGITQTRNFNATGQAAVATTIVEISGDGQAGDAGATLNDPFIVEVRDQDGRMRSVRCDRGIRRDRWRAGPYRHPSVTTDASGRAESTLTLGSATDYEYSDSNGKRCITAPITFTATVVASLSFGTGTD